MSSESSGQVLQIRRNQRGLSLKDVEVATRIRGKYLIAIESNDFTALPNDIYSKGFVQSYANFLGLNGSEIATKYAAERGDRPLELSRPNTTLSGPRLSPRGIVAAVVLLALVAVVGYLFWQFSALAAAPKLEVTNPSKDQVLYGSLITISGKVSGGADVFVNESPILGDATGKFTDSIALQDGVNAIKVTAKNRLGKVSTVNRNILAHIPKTDVAAALPPAPFDGVAVSVQVKDVTTAVVVMADQKEVFHGTMLPGTILVFKAASSMSVSTSNGGATELTVTNATTAAHSLGAVGASGQPKKNIELSKDTQFQ